MSRVPDLVGQRFGRLIVASFRDADHKKRGRWNCLCDCGKGRVVRTGDLRQGHVRSCGCLVLETRRSPAGEAGFRRLMDSYRRNARKKGMIWDLSPARFRQLTSSSCWFCGAPPSLTMTHHHKAADPTARAYAAYSYNGVDRFVNELGYVDGNVVACCKTCNFRKGAANGYAFLAWVLTVAGRCIEPASPPAPRT
jgi:hypothetical protein